MIKDMEDNENSFVALWSEKVQLDCAVLYANSVMNDDQFFNRVTDIDINCEFSRMLESAEKEFVKHNARPFVYSLSNNKLKNAVTERNYLLYDFMHVLQFNNSQLQVPESITVRHVDTNNICDWIDVFCEAFQTENWRNEITRIVTNALNKIQFYLAYYNAKPVGCVALFEKNGLLGLYSLGTLSKYRGRGIGTALIVKAAEIAREKKLALYLQTFRADGFLDFYAKRGFTEVYVKEIYAKRL